MFILLGTGVEGPECDTQGLLFLVLKLQVCGNLVQQAQETNTGHSCHTWHFFRTKDGQKKKKKLSFQPWELGMGSILLVFVSIITYTKHMVSPCLNTGHYIP